MIFPDDLYQQFKEGNMARDGVREPIFCRRCGAELVVTDNISVIDFDEFSGKANSIIVRDYACPNFKGWGLAKQHTHETRRI